MSSIANIIEIICQIKVEDGKVITPSQEWDVRVTRLLIQMIILHQQGFIITCPEEGFQPCAHDLCYQVVCFCLLHQCGPRESFQTRLPAGICGCPFFHETADVDGIYREVSRFVAGNSTKVAVLKSQLERLCATTYETTESNMSSFVYNFIQNGSMRVRLPIPVFAEGRRARVPAVMPPSSRPGTRALSWASVVASSEPPRSIGDQGLSRQRSKVEQDAERLRAEEIRGAQLRRELLELKEEIGLAAQQKKLDETLTAMKLENERVKNEMLALRVELARQAVDRQVDRPGVVPDVLVIQAPAETSGGKAPGGKALGGKTSGGKAPAPKPGGKAPAPKPGGKTTPAAAVQQALTPETETTTEEANDSDA